MGKHPDFSTQKLGQFLGQCRWGDDALDGPIEVFIGGARHSDACPNDNWAGDSICDPENNGPGPPAAFTHP